jgi:DNA-binding CsgD family transcriptional regulator
MVILTGLKQIIVSIPYDYKVFFTFIEHYLPYGFTTINPDDPDILRLERLLHQNNQFFFIGDIIRLKVLFTSKGSKDLFGIEPFNFDPAILLSATHPHDLKRNSDTRTTTINAGQNLFINRKGTVNMSTNLRMKNKEGIYRNLLFQINLFFNAVPNETVYILMVFTDISHIHIAKNTYYHFSENDNSHFRFPDAEMLNPENLFTAREFEIIQLISKGLSSKLIAGRLFLSLHTINTHRRNILKKAGNLSMPELIQAMKENGVV